MNFQLKKVVRDFTNRWKGFLVILLLGTLKKNLELN